MILMVGAFSESKVAPRCKKRRGIISWYIFILHLDTLTLLVQVNRKVIICLLATCERTI